MIVDAWIRRDFPEAKSIAPILADPLNVLLCEGEGGAIFVWRGPGIYEMHCFYEQRGRAVLKVIADHLRTMAEEHGASLIWAAIPVEYRKVKLAARWAGFKPVGTKTFTHGECELFTWEPK